eukprot:1063488-Prorocentrum_minimum.AAC.2
MVVNESASARPRARLCGGGARPPAQTMSVAEARLEFTNIKICAKNTPGPPQVSSLANLRSNQDFLRLFPRLRGCRRGPAGAGLEDAGLQVGSTNAGLMQAGVCGCEPAGAGRWVQV